MQQDSAVFVGLDTSKKKISVAVADEGTGIPPGEEAVIFERGHGHGTGLGLAVAREIVTAEGGRLVLAAACPPRFEVVLATPTPARPTPGSGSTTGDRIVVSG